MTKKGKKLEFISFIKRDGSGTILCGTEWNEDQPSPKTDNMTYLNEVKFKLSRLSISEQTL